ncbi:MAG: 4-hydroxy-tetrahydrodipicolinate synthase [Nitriliruptor sp.]|nr:MAG: 4-hydroxy-tetrahydrodipicolinate synthase [Nitriliruptor sp.]
MPTPPLDHPSPPEGIGRVVTAMVTPLRADRSLDLDGVAVLAEHLVSHGSDTLLVNGTTGESPTLQGEEPLEVLRVVRDTVAGRATVMLGTGSNDTAKTITATAKAEAAGADAVLVVTPYYNRPDQRGLEAHFKAAAAATDLPMVVYDIPSRSARAVEVATHVALAEVENIVGVKDATADCGRAGDLLLSTAGAPGGYAMWSGADEVNLPLLSVGAVGVVSVASHLVGPEIAAMIAAFPTDPARARTLHLDCLPVHRALFGEPSPAPLKGALARLGLPAGPVRPPLADASPAAVDAVLAALQPVQEQR